VTDLFDWGGDPQLSYPDVPGVKERRLNGASRKAAEDIAGSVNTVRAKVFAHLKTDGPRTADETAADLGLDVLTVRPRFSELLRLQLIVATDERRPSSRGVASTVWRAAP
jgi:hypothetical protein